MAAERKDEYVEFFRVLGAELRRLRHDAGLTQEDMISCGFSARHWQQIEGGRPITLRTLLRACDVFEVKASTVLRRTEQAVDG